MDTQPLQGASPFTPSLRHSHKPPGSLETLDELEVVMLALNNMFSRRIDQWAPGSPMTKSTLGK